MLRHTWDIWNFCKSTEVLSTYTQYLKTSCYLFNKVKLCFKLVLSQKKGVYNTKIVRKNKSSWNFASSNAHIFFEICFFESHYTRANNILIKVLYK